MDLLFIHVNATFSVAPLYSVGEEPEQALIFTLRFCLSVSVSAGTNGAVENEKRSHNTSQELSC